MLNLTTQQSLFILQGAGWTILLSLIGFVGGSLLGLPLALGLTAKSMATRLATGFGINVVQGIPLPILMFAVYFGAGLAGFDPPTLAAAALAMTAYSAAFLAEIWKGCIRAVPRLQWEAADCLALTSLDTLRLVILPQAVRIATPPTIGFFVQIVKNTSYAVVLAFMELTYSARIVNNNSNEPFVVFTIAGALYFLICFPLSKLSRRLERSFGKTREAAK
ncbi:amino acid ABC transporter permease [Azospirillum sp. TSH64]|uniref:amino acid ABC transporter permease n=1 Tax=Azospirillum sp. TSH64 TaxID=652740 RepID=UPI000D61A4CE|nr:amino acid ABC transporter permease [Azospirillum sp. TSH64]PWC78099.1 amino acid ABC transporter permease [Azospirillum sp. TSH64]